MKILVLCTGNSARSILLEALLNQYGVGRIDAWSAGSQPVGMVHPEALALLARKQFPTAGLHSKSWDLFAEPDAPVMDAVITVCGNAAGEICPIWPGAPVRAHWGVDDPAAKSEQDWPRAFAKTYEILASRTRSLLKEPIESMSGDSLVALLSRIGETE